MLDLEKSKQKVNLVLEKRGVRKAPTAEVVWVNDTSGSAKSMHTDGTIQSAMERIFAIASTFDDDGNLEAYSFNTVVDPLPAINVGSVNNYVNSCILNNRSVRLWGGTKYSVALDSVVKKFFGEKTKAQGFLSKLFSKDEPKRNSSNPVVCFFQTDGANDTWDANETERILRDSQEHNIYWQFVGVGSPSYFGFIQQMGDKYPNVGFVNLQSLNISEEDLFEQVISQELCDWLGK